MVTVSSLTSSSVCLHRVRHLIHRRKGIVLRKLHAHTHLRADLGFDTLDVVDIILEVERCFHLTIPDEVPLDTVGDFVRFLEASGSLHALQQAAA